MEGWRRVFGRPPDGDVGLRRVGLRLAAQTVGLVLVMLIVLEVVVYVITQGALLNSLQTSLAGRSNPPADFVRDIYHLNPAPHYPSGPSGGHGGSFPPGGNSGQPTGGQPPSGGGPNGGQGPGGPFGPNPDQSPSDVSSVFISRQLQIVHVDGALGNVVLSRADVVRALSSGHYQCCSVRRYGDEDYLVSTAPLSVNGTRVGAVQLSISEHQYEDAMETLLRTLLVVALLGLLGASGVSVLLVQRALRPIRTAVQRQRDFVADAAHELRTPLAIQRTVAEVVLGGAGNDEYETTLEQMLVENKHLTRLVDDLSLLARADSNAVAITPAPMNLSALVTETASELEPLAEERGMRLTASVAEDIWVMGDVTRLRQLLLVLLDNAMKYTPQGGDVSVSLRNGGGRAQLQVRDSGPGIDPADLPRVFDRFYRSDRARTGEGSGLGLAIARWIVQAHGGQLGAANVSPHGAVFSALLPVRQSGGSRL